MQGSIQPIYNPMRQLEHFQVEVSDGSRSHSRILPANYPKSKLIEAAKAMGATDIKWLRGL